MGEIELNISVNRRTKELIGYWSPDGDPIGIIVKAYAVDDLERKFEEAKKQYINLHGGSHEVYVQLKKED